MAVSGSVDFGLVTNTIIEKAFHRLGIASQGEAMTARMYEDGRSSLDLMVKAWGASDHLWLRTEASKALVAATASYALTPKPSRVLEVRRRDTDSYDFTMAEWSRAEYTEQPAKTSAGPPIAWYYDAQATTGTLYVWPRPATADAAEYTLYFTYLRRINDFDASNNDQDLPQEWLEALVWNLADNLETEYPVRDARIAAKIERKAAQTLAAIEAWDTETGSIFLQPAGDYWGY